MNGAAVISADGVYRYLLTREWGPGRSVCWIMLNPSTADAEQDDPTIRRCIGFAKAWGYGRLEVVNLFALRATNPAALRAHPFPDGPLNRRAVMDAARRNVVTVAAWGAHGAYLGRGSAMAAALARERIPVTCLGRSKGGHPRHPLYLRADTPLEPLGVPA